MPQMSPLNWLTLFFMFSIIYFLFNIMNYYNNLPISCNKTMLMPNINYNWKW